MRSFSSLAADYGNGQLLTTGGANNQSLNSKIAITTFADSMLSTNIVKPAQGSYIAFQNNNEGLFTTTSNRQAGAKLAGLAAIVINQMAAQVPEPSAFLMIMLGLIGIG